MPTGEVAPGWVGDDWLQHRRPAACPGAILFRTDDFRAHGGWMALQGSEDTGALVAISERWAGLGIDAQVLLYRKWSGSTTSDAAWRDGHARQQAVIAARLQAMRQLPSLSDIRCRAD